MEVLLGAIVGLAYVAPPGPVNIETVRRGLAGGFLVALRVQLGAIIGDLSYAVLALAGAALLVTQSITQTLLGIVGTGLLLYLGWSSLRNGWRGRIAPLVSPEFVDDPLKRLSLPSKQSSFWTGVAVSVANPYGVAFWLSVGGAILQNPHRNAGVFLGGFFLGALLWALFIATLVGWGHSFVSPWSFRLVSFICGVVLVAFGLTLGYSTLLK